MSLRERWREWRESGSEYDAAAQEMAFHIEQETERNISHGMTPEAARREALRVFGGVDRYVEASRDERTGRLLADLGMDIRYALRALRRAPVFTFVAVLTLALGIGGNSAVFSVVNAVLLRPLPFPEPERLVQVRLTTEDQPDMVWSYPKFELLRQEARSFAHSAGYVRWEGNLTGDGEPERLRGERVTADYFALLGVTPRVGRVFSADAAVVPARAHEVLLGEALWRGRFNADSGVVGRTVQLDGMPATVVGVVPAEFRGLSGVAQVFLPVSGVGEMLSAPFAHFMTVVARLQPGITFEQAQGEAVMLGARIHEQYRSPRDAGVWGADTQRLTELRIDPAIARSVLVLFGAVAAVLLIACANLMNLLLARGSRRRREMAVRLALGAQRNRLVRQLITEAFVLAAVGGAFGLLIAWAGVRLLANVAASAVNILGRETVGLSALTLGGIQLDGTVLWFATAATVGTALLFGVIPALHSARADLTTDLKEGGAGTLGLFRVRGLTTRNLLATAEIALAFVLLVGSGLMLRSLSQLLDLDAGVDPRNLLTLRVSLPESTAAGETLPVFWEQLLHGASSLPTVQRAALADCPPLIGRCSVRPLWLGPAGASEPLPVGVHYVTADYFSALGVPLRSGRAFGAQDRAGSANVVIINEAAAQKFFPDEDPIGRRVAVAGGFADGAEIVGVVGNQRFAGLQVLPEPDVYIAYPQVPQQSSYLFIRTAGEPLALAGAVRSLVQQLNPKLPIFDVQTMEQRFGAATARTRVTGMSLTVFATVAFLLALVGVYGLLAYAVSQRTREIGLRLTLGATPRHVALLMLRHCGAVVGIGLALGLLGAWSTTRVLRSLLYDVAPTDPLVFAGLAVATLIFGFAASAVPVFHASRIDPATSLRAG